MPRQRTLDTDAKTLGIIEGLAKIQCTQSEAAAVLGVVRESFNRFLARNLTARERWEFGVESGKASLRRNQFKISETNASMAIWLGKQYLGQREPRYEGDEQVPLGKKEQAQLDAETAGRDTGWGELLDWKH
jgi:3-methyladenine DNA glycosylase Tag